jgi:hypothetical protein
MRRTADRLFGRENYHWSVLGAGRNQMPIAAMAAAMVATRVGLEDLLWLGPGKLNNRTPRKSQSPASRTCLETRARRRAFNPQAKGGDKVAF